MSDMPRRLDTVGTTAAQSRARTPGTIGLTVGVVNSGGGMGPWNKSH